MIANLRPTSDADIDRLLADPAEITRFLYGAEADGFERVGLNKAWHAIHFVMTGSRLGGEEPLNFLVSEGTPVGEVDVGYGPARVLTSAQVRSLALAIACDIHPLGNLRVLNYLRSNFEADEGAVNAWAGEWIGLGFKALEQRVKHTSGDGRHMFGTEVTLADLCLVPQMYNARRYRCDLQPYPGLRAICAHLEALPAFARAAPEAQPDAPPANP